MGCGCGKGKTSGTRTWVVTSPDGAKKTYSSEMDARTAAARSGGTVRAS